MVYTTHRCPNCGASLPPPTAVLRCEFCGQRLTPGDGKWISPAADDETLVDPDRPRLWLGGVRYRVMGRIAKGDSSDVFLGRRDARVTEIVAIKVLRSPPDADLLAGEFETLRALQACDAQGAAHFSRLVPQPVAHGIARLGLKGGDGERIVSILRWRSGFLHTFDDLRAAHPDGVAPEHGIWLWKRILEVLGWVHRAGRVHAAIVPRHLLVHPRDHGVSIVGWTCSAPLDSPAPAMVREAEDLLNGAPLRPEHDVAMSARCVAQVLAKPVPAEFSDLLERQAAMKDPLDAWALLERIDAMARRVFGPPKYIVLSMPGW